MDCTNKQKGAVDNAGPMGVVFGDVVLGVHGEGFEYLFSYAAGGMESLVANGREWLYRAPKPTFWRAVTDNDRGCGFPFRSAMWMGADLFIQTKEIRIFLDGEEVKDFLPPGNNRFGGEVEAKTLTVSYTYRTATVPETEVGVSYKVEPTGRIGVDVHYYGKEGLPQLPVFGMRFIMPTKAEGYTYCGLSGETYPDRKAGGVKGIYEVSGLPVTPYLVPQECGMHMDTEWLTVRRLSSLANGPKTDAYPIGGGDGGSLTFEKDGEPFAFTCLPYTAEELENATHQEELPRARRTVACILGAVRGVGGIDSWGSDVEEAYHIDAGKDIVYSFFIVTGAPVHG